MVDDWQGAIAIDDPLKVGDAYSRPRRAKANRDLIATAKDPRANPDMSIVVIVQRLAQEDVTGVIEAGNLGPDSMSLAAVFLVTSTQALRYVGWDNRPGAQHQVSYYLKQPLGNSGLTAGRVCYQLSHDFDNNGISLTTWGTLILG